MQKDLDACLDQYNRKRFRQGRFMNCRTPLSAFVEDLPKTENEGKMKTQKAV